MNQRSAILLLAFIALYLHEISGFGTNFWKIRERIENYQKKEALKHRMNSVIAFERLARVEENYFEQPLDHFDPLVTDTYRQRYFVNVEHWKKPNGPVFLYIGGEGAISEFSVQTGEHIELAEKYGALVFAVEHRFYGQSLNDDGFKLDQMQYLSSQQALADLASFHSFAEKSYNLTEKNTWICFGGSYPGALSAWFRIKYPHLVFGAISSSAPVHAKVDFQGYNNVVADSLADPIVNGSAECTASVREAFNKIDAMIKSGEHETLAQDFKSCEDLTKEEDVYQFVSNLADLFMGVVQYNNEMPGSNIGSLCNAITAGPDPYTALKLMNAKFLNETAQKCLDNSWDAFIAQLSNTTFDRPMEGVGIRQWIYQTCTQFGYYQSCEENTNCPFSKFMGLQPDLDICTIVFKIPANQIPSRIDFTNAYYGSDQPRGTRIVFVNGSIDPWHALSVLNDLSATETAIFINGTAHCANMQSAKQSDPPQLRQARQKTDAQIGKWLKEAQVDNNVNYRYIRPFRKNQL